MIAFSRLSIALTLLLGTLLFPLATTKAAEIEVDSTRALAEAIENASDGDVIVLTGDIALQRYLPRVTADITIEGGGYTISGGGKYRIFIIEKDAAVTINALGIVSGAADKIPIERRLHFKEGGAIVNLHGSLTICNSMFAGSTADYGGAIVNLGTLHICNSRFAGNGAINGGAIYHDAGRLTVESSTFTGNVADRAGGAIFNGGGDVFIGGSNFIGNVAPSGGGAIVIAEFGTVNVSGSAFNSNSASRGDGGAINIWYRSKLTARDCAFQRNFASAGGAISSLGDLLDIRSSTFIENTAGGPGGEGGAIQSGKTPGANWQSVVHISSSGFEGNRADYGGAIFFHGAESVDIINSTLWGNEATDGGGVFISAGPVTLTHITMWNNFADRGGSVYAKDNVEYPHSRAKLRIRNSLIGDGDQRFSGYKSDDCVAEAPYLISEQVDNISKDGTCGPGLSGDLGLALARRPNDGSPAYFPLDADGRAIDAADSRYCAVSDQIGTARPQGAGCDIGAVEFTG